jgi:hypothetical protein
LKLTTNPRTPMTIINVRGEAADMKCFMTDA